jgi:hypothetical protein
VGGNDGKMDQGTSALRLRAELVLSQPFEGGVKTLLIPYTIEMRLLNQLSKSTIDVASFVVDIC